MSEKKEEIMKTESKCVKCGRNKFELSRMADYQILAVCINCGEPHTIEAIDKKTGKVANLNFWSPKMEK
jgi:uncharacterized Zn finger protein